MKKPIFLGADHAGFDIKNILIEDLDFKNIDFEDLGAYTLDSNDDYTKYAQAVSEAVLKNPGSVGVLICGNAEGVCIVANKFDGIRAGIGYSIQAAKSMKTDDNANILCLPGRLNIDDDPIKILETFLITPFSEKKRHKKRLKHIKEIERNN